VPLGPGTVARRTATTSRYAARFRCIGTACEDNCCAHSWQVLLDRQDYGRLKVALAGSPDGQATFARGCLRTPGATARDRRFATLQRTPDGRCVFLAPDGLCAVHTAHGAAALPGVCATYPRVLTEAGAHLSLTATLSCPEAARLCLLAEDAVRMDAADAEAIALLRVRHRVSTASHDPFVRHFPAIRTAFLDLIAMRDYPVASRLYATAHLARRLDAAPAARGRAAADSAVHEAIAACGDAQTLAGLDRECRSATVSGALPVALVRQILLAVLERQRATRFGSLVESVCGPELEADAGPAPRRRSGRRGARDEWVPAFELRRRQWEAEFGGRIAQYAANYAADYWMRDPFTASPDLLGFVLGMLARVAVIRFLLFGHPSLHDLGAPGSSSPLRQQALDRAAVEVVYTFARAVEHSAELRALLHECLSQPRLRGRRALLELARF
jgi:lysine-N-methylase